ncbi:ureidoglycolate hydrolase [Acidithiobacillus sp. CV18-2]|uniref:Ureidoglycolate hydrolase n=2 Tax=Igneacidithiobacillus copahuensis TaxID=2724909 RepID=A0AAE3CJU4_9PROT|nr:ureidoglycolate hydrolase [Acidithiobacillus sp. CV18-3]MBU2756708.1 ureidoglycolate hydrolase [Acidithiobacillus sp. BN09-2]MBU2776593.1 ureidoglycolate hydrolase [Acidithiobacillus sp. CV18-2]MBU2788121.1 ureidoglycolate hydrolase [Igneacidithiobacillus copahuensis]MBU2796966.1 ureidoglycolate hydrolase [Acidithiobacillus sp. VAN18-2]MBU2798194.1 ureidoglycolate hydrolase [Acidithiobacillus sp. VAN18-4]UTV80449.1 ureidoglycolate lyase [Acidithiobacillus sp. YTS05]
MGSMEQNIVNVPLIDADQESLRDYGVMISEEVYSPGLAIPFYRGSVEEGQNLDFVYTGKAVVRTARISHRSPVVTWLERHLHMSQIFVGLGSSPFVMVLAKPNHLAGGYVPDLADVMAFRIPAGHGVMIHPGTWHDFPMAFDGKPVTVLTMNSDEVVTALASAKAADEMDAGDVYKIDIERRTGKVLRVPF